MISESFRRAVDDFCKYNLVRLDDVEKKFWPKNLSKDPHEAYSVFRYSFHEFLFEAFSLAVERIETFRRMDKLAHFFRDHISSSPKFWESLEREVSQNLHSDYWFISKNFPVLLRYVENAETIGEGVSGMRYSMFERGRMPELKNRVRKLGGAVDEIAEDFHRFSVRMTSKDYVSYDSFDKPQDVTHPRGAFGAALLSLSENLAENAALEERLARLVMAEYHYFEKIDPRYNKHSHLDADGFPVDHALQALSELHLKGAERFDRKAVLIEGKARACNVLYHPLSLPAVR